MTETTEKRTGYNPERVQRLALLRTVREGISTPARAADAARRLMRLLDEWPEAPEPADPGALQALLAALPRPGQDGRETETEGGVPYAGRAQDRV